LPEKKVAESVENVGYGSGEAHTAPKDAVLLAITELATEIVASATR